MKESNSVVNWKLWYTLMIGVLILIIVFLVLLDQKYS